MVVFPFLFHIFMPLANLLFIILQGQFSILRTRSCPDLYLLLRPPRRPWALGRGESFFWNSFGSLLCQLSVTSTLSHQEVSLNIKFRITSLFSKLSSSFCSIITFPKLPKFISLGMLYKISRDFVAQFHLPPFCHHISH